MTAKKRSVELRIKDLDILIDEIQRIEAEIAPVRRDVFEVKEGAAHIDAALASATDALKWAAAQTKNARDKLEKYGDQDVQE